MGTVITRIQKVIRLLQTDSRNTLPRLVEEKLRAKARGHDGARIARGVKMYGAGTYKLGHNCRIKPQAQIFVAPGASLEVGDESAIGIRNIVNVVTAVRIGKGSRLSWDCQILDTDFHEILDEHGNPRPMTAPVIIGDHVLVGARAMILKGVTIGDGAIVGAGSVVSRDVPPNTIVAGNPARPVGLASGWSPGRVGSA